ncbi:MAG: hypothetical protein WCJ61_06445 [Paludibacter sp.]
MEYNFTINTDKKIITVQTSGELIKNEVAKMDKRIRTKAKELNCSILFDFRQSKNRITMADAFFWFTELYENDENPLISIPTVHLSSAEDEQFFRFFEITTNNNGIPIKMFTDNMHAIEWLKQF